MSRASQHSWTHLRTPSQLTAIGCTIHICYVVRPTISNEKTCSSESDLQIRGETGLFESRCRGFRGSSLGVGACPWTRRPGQSPIAASFTHPSRPFTSSQPYSSKWMSPIRMASMSPRPATPAIAMPEVNRPTRPLKRKASEQCGLDLLFDIGYSTAHETAGRTFFLGIGHTP